MCSTLSSCRLYSWMRLIWLSKIDVGVERDARRSALSQSANRDLGRPLGLPEPLAEGGVVGQRDELPQLVRGR